ncbi:MAG: HupE/UreJ family protein [Saprospiraceae bacterium]|nr:HupE/UreJ family protein [Saprospiraceae bacterium]
MFSVYFPLGFEHIVSLKGFDHLLFIVVLCAFYSVGQWRKLLVLLTGFTLGHSLTLALTALQVVSFPAKWIELLIPITILATSILNVTNIRTEGHRFLPYLLATVFGLVHGCGFAGYFTMMLGDEGSIIEPLFLFNLGLEFGQITIVVLFYGAFWALTRFRSIESRDWNLFVSGAGAGLAIKLILEAI